MKGHEGYVGQGNSLIHMSQDKEGWEEERIFEEIVGENTEELMEGINLHI
jgi:hypothetical protein